MKRDATMGTALTAMRTIALFTQANICVQMQQTKNMTNIKRTIEGLEKIFHPWVERFPNTLPNPSYFEDPHFCKNAFFRFLSKFRF